MFGFKKIAMPKAAQALPGRGHAIRTAAAHFVNHQRTEGALSGGPGEGDVRARLLLGRREQSSGSWATACMSPPSAMPAV